MAWLTLTCMLLAALPSAIGYPTGAPRDVCSSMLPNHGYNPQPLGNDFFEIQTNSDSYGQGQELTVTLVSKRRRDGTQPPFKGFFLQAQSNNGRRPVGRWIVNDPRQFKTVNCGQQGDSITHAERLNTRSLTLTWRAPANAEPIGMRATIVQDYDKYYLDITSKQLVASGGGGGGGTGGFPQTPSNYEALGGNCPGQQPELCIGCRVITDCATQCDNNPQCRGFSFVNTNPISCLLKNVDCTNPRPNPTVQFYKKMQRQPPQPPGPGPARPPVKGYARLNGDCPNGPELERCPSCTTPLQCGTRCVSSPSCPGFSFDFTFQQCVLRSQDCTSPRQTPDSNFYRKASELGCGTTNEGKEFWIVFLENTNVNNPKPTLELFAAAGKDARDQIQVRVTSPEMQEISVTVQPRDVQRIEVPATMKMEKTQKARKGIKITATEDIVIYGVNKNTYSTDGFLGLPVNAIGNEYYVVTYFPPFSL